MKQKQYFKHAVGWKTPIKFASRSFRTKKILKHYEDGTTQDFFEQKDVSRNWKGSDEWIKDGHWIPISYKEAMELIKEPLVISNDVNSLYSVPVVLPIDRYFVHKEGFIGDVAFVKCAGKFGKSYFKDGSRAATGFSCNLDECLQKVKRGIWKEITKDEADALINPKTVENDYSLIEFSMDEDVYSVECYLNGEIKYKSGLTKEEAKNFKAAALKLSNFLTKAYDV